MEIYITNMPEIDNKKTVANGIIGLLLVLAGFGGNIVLYPDEFTNAYVCPITENVGIFHRISSTGKTGYYNDTFGVEKSIACRSGNTYASWVSLDSYLTERGLNKKDFIVKTIMNPTIPLSEDINIGKKWICGFNNCTRIQ